jgi:oligosaccharyltransferase complex subunit beta
MLWAFHEKGILRVKSVAHNRVNETESSAVYTIKEMLQYKIEIEEYTGRRWVPFVADDVQLEFIMLDPYLRTNLKSDGKGTFTSIFQIPDVYGFFTFKVEYSRKGFSHLNSITRVPVRPFRHTQYERFIHAAYPYYAGSLSMLVGLFLFSWVFLNFKN